MSFLRPSARAVLVRWREFGLSLTGAAFGLWVATRGGVFYGVLGAFVAAFAAGLALQAWRRLRFSTATAAPGLVRIREGAIAYFGPETGGVVALSELTEIAAAPHPDGLAWRLTQADGTVLSIPAAAQGADQLFDSFAALPGAAPRRFLAALEHPPTEARPLWRRHGTPDPARLPRS